MQIGLDSAGALKRFWPKVSRQPNGCWLWLAHKTPKGYGQFGDERLRVTRAHRWAYRTFVGDIPKGRVLDHLCQNPSCVNPEHLEPVTPRENAYRSKVWMNGYRYQKAKTHCPQGHPYDEVNTITDKDGHRACRTCRRLRGH